MCVYETHQVALDQPLLGVSVKIHNAHGGGPDHVVDSAIRQSRNAAYDRVATLLDTDVEMSATTQKRAMSKRIQIIGSTPCFEGLLLQILDKPVPHTSAGCKTRIGGLLSARLMDPDNYQTNFSKDVLEKRRHDVPELDALLKCIASDR